MQERTKLDRSRIAWITGAAVAAVLAAALALMGGLGGKAGADAAQAAKTHPMPKKPITGGCYAIRAFGKGGGCGHHPSGCFYGHGVGGKFVKGGKFKQAGKKFKQGKVRKKHRRLRPMHCVQIDTVCIGKRGKKKNKHGVRRLRCVFPPKACAFDPKTRRKHCVRGGHGPRGGGGGIVEHKTQPPGPNWKFPKNPKSPMPVIR